MSRAGKYPVKLSDGVTVAIADNAVVVKGPKGELKLPLDTKNAGLVDIVIEEGQVVINPKDAEEKQSRTMWGTMARNIRNAVEGVSKGFEKPMYMRNVSSIGRYFFPCGPIVSRKKLFIQLTAISSRHCFPFGTFFRL